MGLGFSVLGVAGLIARAGEPLIAITAISAELLRGFSSVWGGGVTIAAGINSCYWHTILIVMIGIVSVVAGINSHDR